MWARHMTKSLPAMHVMASMHMGMSCFHNSIRLMDERIVLRR